MSEIRFEWDPRKARSNEAKHGVSFEEAETVFSDEQGLLFEDPAPAEREERFALLGLSSSLRLLVVLHALRHEDTIRIISARRASRREARTYFERLR
jgi:uncharacterized protein